MVTRFLFVMVAAAAIFVVGLLGRQLERWRTPNDVIAVIVCLLFGAIAYGIVTIGPTLH